MDAGDCVVEVEANRRCRHAAADEEKHVLLGMDWHDLTWPRPAAPDFADKVRSMATTAGWR